MTGTLADQSTHRSMELRSDPRLDEGWVCFAAQDWWYHSRAHSDVQLMLRVARQRPVLFVNSIGMRMPLPGRTTQPLRRIARKAASVAKLLRRPVPELPDFHVMTPLVVPFYGSAAARRVNASLVRTQVRAALRYLDITNPSCFVTIPTAWDVVRALPHRRLVFNRSDKHSMFAEADQTHVRALEEALLRAADVVVYVSRALMAEEVNLSGSRAVFLDHGVDLQHFRRRAPGDEPDDLRSIPHPRLGFFGLLDQDLVDLALLERLARSLPHAHLVLVGPATCSMRSLQSLPNVHWLGARSYEAVPRYGSGFDVALMPWRTSEWIRYCNPIKLKEYLSLGLPVVTTDFEEARTYRDVMRIAVDHEDFVEQVRRTLVDGGGAGADQRRATVADASWDRRAHQLLALVAQSAAGNSHGPSVRRGTGGQ